MSRMFVRVQRGTGQPILGGFIVLSDHRPRGWYREVVFKTSLPETLMSVANNGSVLPDGVNQAPTDVLEASASSLRDDDKLLKPKLDTDDDVLVDVAPDENGDEDENDDIFPEEEPEEDGSGEEKGEVPKPKKKKPSSKSTRSKSNK